MFFCFHIGQGKLWMRGTHLLWDEMIQKLPLIPGILVWEMENSESLHLRFDSRLYSNKELLRKLGLLPHRSFYAAGLKGFLEAGIGVRTHLRG